jgi:poly(A) polymerase
MAPELSVVSVERIAQELRKMLVHRNRRRAVELCRETGLLDVVLPGWSSEQHAAEETLKVLDELEEPSFGLALAVLLRSVPNPDLKNRKAPLEAHTVRGHCRRLKLSTEELESCLWLHAHQHDLERVATMSDAALKRLLAHPLSGELQKWFAAQAALDEQKAHELAVLKTRSSVWTPEDLDPPPFVTGQDILAMGLKPGPRLKELLDAVRTAQLNGEVTSAEAAKALLERLI